jgi:soluble lytic murein transglycosylase-like protein
MATIPNRVAKWLPEAKAAASIFGVDPLVMLALCDRESKGNPLAESPDGGMGLYQITRKYHPTFCSAVGPDGKLLVFHPGWNTMYAAALLRMNLDHFDGVVDEPLLPAIAAFNASERRVREKLRELSRPASKEQIVAALDPLTTPTKPGEAGDYLSDVLSKRSTYVLSP